MSLSKTYSVHCDECYAWIAEEPIASDARRKAKNAGWKRRRVKFGKLPIDLCPRCVAKPVRTYRD